MTHGINLGSHEYWSPDASFTQVVKGSWKGQRRELRVFILSSPQFLATLRYIHAGTHLPVTREEYSRHFGVDLSGIPEIASRVDGLVKSYGEVKSKATEFRDKTWQAVVDFAGQINEYSKLAGGDPDSSYYGNLMQCITDYNLAKRKNPQDNAKMEESKSAIADLAQELLGHTSKLQKGSKDLQHRVDHFDSDTYNNWASLNARLEDIKRRLDKDERQHLEDVVKTLQMASLLQRWGYDNDVTSAAQSPEYARCALYGVLPATTASKQGPRVSAIKDVVQATEEEIRTDETRLKSARVVGSDAQRTTQEAQAVTKHVQSAKDAFRDLDLAWGKITANLQNLQDLAKQKDAIPDVVFEANTIKSTIDSWNAFGSSVDAFRKRAFTIEPLDLSVEEWIKKIG